MNDDAKKADLSCHCIDKGEGQAIILLHGWGCDRRMMEFIQDGLQDHYHVWNIDLPGFGKSAEPPMPWSVEEYADWLYAWCRQKQIHAPILIAHSFGARIALCFAGKYEVSKMVLTGAAGIPPKHGISYYLRVGTYKVLKHIKKEISMGSEDYRNANAMMKQILVKAVHYDVRPILKQIVCPTLLVWGEEDTATPLWMGKQLAASMPHATLVTLEDDDHFAFVHQPKRFLAILRYFL